MRRFHVLILAAAVVMKIGRSPQPFNQSYNSKHPDTDWIGKILLDLLEHQSHVDLVLLNRTPAMEEAALVIWYCMDILDLKYNKKQKQTLA